MLSEPLFHACVCAVEAATLCLVVLYARRAKRHAAAARIARDLAWLSERDAARHAERVEGMLPPDVLPFDPPVPPPSGEPKTVNGRCPDAAFRPRLAESEDE